MTVWLVKQTVNGYGIVMAIHSAQDGAKREAARLSKRNPDHAFWIQRERVKEPKGGDR